MGWLAWRGRVARARESQAAVVHCASVVPEERDADLVRAVQVVRSRLPRPRAFAHSKKVTCRVGVVLLSRVHHLSTAWKSDSTRRKGHHYSD